MNTLSDMADALGEIQAIAMGHASFDGSAFQSRDIQALARVGGDTFDWTMVAIIADEALEKVAAYLLDNSVKV